MEQDLELIAFEGDAPEDVIDAFCASVDADGGTGSSADTGGGEQQAKEAHRLAHCAEPLLPIVRLIMGFDAADK